MLLLAMLTACSPADTPRPAAAPAAGGASAGSPSTCALSDPTWPVETAEDALLASYLAVPPNATLFWIESDVRFALDVAAAFRGVTVEELPCPTVEVTEDTLRIDAGTGCTLRTLEPVPPARLEGLFVVTSSASEVRYTFEDFVADLPSWSDPQILERQRLDGTLWYGAADELAWQGADLVATFEGGPAEIEYEQTTMSATWHIESWMEDSEVWSIGSVEVHDADGGPTGAFCIDEQVRHFDDCPSGRDGRLQVEGRARGELTWDDDESCDGCYLYALNDEPAEWYCP